MEGTATDAPASATPFHGVLVQRKLCDGAQLNCCGSSFFLSSSFPTSLSLSIFLKKSSSICSSYRSPYNDHWCDAHSFSFFSPFRLGFPASWIEVVSDAAAVLRSPWEYSAERLGGREGERQRDAKKKKKGGKIEEGRPQNQTWIYKGVWNTTHIQEN